MSCLAIHPQGVHFKPDEDIPDFTGKIILVTGGVSSSIISHMGHALMLKYLLPLMAKTTAAGRDVRLITTSCPQAPLKAPPSSLDYTTIKTPQAMVFGHFRRYMQSKMANTLYSQKIADLYLEIISCSIQPGAVASDIGGTHLGLLDKLFTRLNTGGKYVTPEEGAYTM